MVTNCTIFIEKFIISGKNIYSGDLYYLCYKPEIKDRKVEFPSPEDLRWDPIRRDNIYEAAYKLLFFDDVRMAEQYAIRANTLIAQVNIKDVMIESISLVSRGYHFINPTWVPRCPSFPKDEDTSDYPFASDQICYKCYHKDHIDNQVMEKMNKLEYDMSEIKNTIYQISNVDIDAEEIRKSIIAYIEPYIDKTLTKSEACKVVNYLLQEKFMYTNMRKDWLKGKLIPVREFNNKMRDYELDYFIKRNKKEPMPKTKQLQKLTEKQEETYTIRKRAQ